MRSNYIQEIKQFIEEAQAVLITAGAGMGVDSGLPDFRGDEGFWRAYPAIKELQISFEEMANPQWFVTKPSLAWAFYGHRLNLYKNTVPHNGFAMLLDLVRKKNNDYFIMTSNVDGQFQKAGFSKDKIVEIHGSIYHFQCIENCMGDIWDADDKEIEIDMEKFEALDIPQCKYCSNIARPNILMFGDRNWNVMRTFTQEERFDAWIGNVRSDGKKLVIIEIGAGTAIPTIQSTGEKLAKKIKGAKLIRINPREYYLNRYRGWGIPYGGMDGLKKILT